MLSLFEIDWTGIPRKSPWGKFLRFWLKLIPKGTVVRILGGPNKGFKWRVGAGLHSCWLGTYELAKHKLVRDETSPGMVVYDLGANAGFYTLLFSRHVGDSGRVYAMEALPENSAALLDHVKINCLSNVIVLPLGVSDREGLAPFIVSPDSSMGRLGGGKEGLMVPVYSLDALIERGIPAPDLIKMDVEGAETDVLKGAGKLLASGKCRWFISPHSAALAEECIAIMKKAGYETAVIREAKLPSGERFPDELVCRRAGSVPPAGPFSR